MQNASKFRGKRGKPQKVGKYVLDEKLGVGGFGVVRKAHHEVTGETVAVKILDKAQLQLMEMTSQIKREITLLTSLKHPNIVSGVDILNSPAKLYLVMEFVNGGDMHTMISKKKRIPEHQARSLFKGLIDCLVYCHRRGVTHRDLKLENLLITKTGELKVCDFGLASVRDTSGDASQLCNTIVGTEDFAAPEILFREAYDGAKADMWSAGVILYTMIAGFCPFRGNDTTELFNAIKCCRFTFPQSFPHGPKAVVNHLLVRDPKRRLSAEELIGLEWFGARDQERETLNTPDPPPSVTRRITPRHRSLGISDVVSGGDGDQPITSFSKGSGLGHNASSNSLRGDSRAPSLRVNITQNPCLVLAGQSIPDFTAIYATMRANARLVQDRRYRLKVYPKTFVGSELVTCIAEYKSVSREKALEIGDNMLQAEVFHHVCRDHSFKDEYLFYRFAEDDVVNSNVLNMRQLWPAGVSVREPLIVTSSLLSSLLALVRIHQALPLAGSSTPCEVDIQQLRKDDAFFAFRMACAELQAVDLTSLRRNAEKATFLTDLYHIMILHMRIYGVGTSSGRLQKAKQKLEYNVAGTRLTLNDIYDVLSGCFSGTPRASGNDESLQSVLQSKFHKGAISALRYGLNAKSPTSLISGFSRSSKGSYLATATSKSVEHENALPLLFLSTASPTCPPIEVSTAHSFEDNEIQIRLGKLIVQQISFPDEGSVDFPCIVFALRKLKRLHGDRELLLHVAEALENTYHLVSDDAGEDKVALKQAAKEASRLLRELLTTELPASIGFEEPENDVFAPCMNLPP